jgi:vacuolar-type H+-ATPase subunit E/Vma4
MEGNEHRGNRAESRGADAPDSQGASPAESQDASTPVQGRGARPRAEARTAAPQAAPPTEGGDLIAGITRDAEAEAERLLEEAREAAEERLQAAEGQGARILEEARAKAETQARTVHAQATSALRMESKRAALKVREEVLRRVLQAARDRLAAMVETPAGARVSGGGASYGQILLGWIVEGAIGLNVPEAEVNVSARERAFLEPELLRQAERTVKELTGRTVALKPAKGDPLPAQGVVLRSADGRLEFNNQVSTRLLRYQSEVRKKVFEALDR